MKAGVVITAGVVFGSGLLILAASWAVVWADGVFRGEIKTSNFMSIVAFIVLVCFSIIGAVPDLLELQKGDADPTMLHILGAVWLVSGLLFFSGLIMRWLNRRQIRA